jgi:hypothetical protein
VNVISKYYNNIIYTISENMRDPYVEPPTHASFIDSMYEQTYGDHTMLSRQIVEYAETLNDDVRSSRELIRREIVPLTRLINLENIAVVSRLVNALHIPPPDGNIMDDKQGIVTLFVHLLEENRVSHPPTNQLDIDVALQYLQEISVDINVDMDNYPHTREALSAANTPPRPYSPRSPRSRRRHRSRSPPTRHIRRTVRQNQDNNAMNGGKRRNTKRRVSKKRKQTRRR